MFDFALKERMQNGSIADWKNGLNGNPDPRWREVAVTFVDNHDTGYSPGQNGGQHHWPLQDGLIRQAYAYILTSPGTPVVYWSHMYDWGYRDFIRQLIGCVAPLACVPIRRSASTAATAASSPPSPAASRPRWWRSTQPEQPRRSPAAASAKQSIPAMAGAGLAHRRRQWWR